MCANCVSSIDAAVAAVGGVAGLRAWLSTRLELVAALHRIHAAVGMFLLLAVVVGSVAVRHL